jgi:hypothetical protein
LEQRFLRSLPLFLRKNGAAQTPGMNDMPIYLSAYRGKSIILSQAKKMAFSSFSEEFDA